MSNIAVDFRYGYMEVHNETQQDKNALHIALHVTQKCVTHLRSCDTFQLNNRFGKFADFLLVTHCCCFLLLIITRVGSFACYVFEFIIYRDNNVFLAYPCHHNGER